MVGRCAGVGVVRVGVGRLVGLPTDVGLPTEVGLPTLEGDGTVVGAPEGVGELTVVLLEDGEVDDVEDPAVLLADDVVTPTGATPTGAVDDDVVPVEVLGACRAEDW